MKIVIPTDFSHCAEKAMQFGASFAKQVKGQLILLHVLPDFGPSLGTLPTSHLKEQVLNEAVSKLQQLEASLQAEGIPVNIQLAYGGTVAKGLESFLNMNGADLVIMGSHGASGIKKVLLGSNTVDVVNHTTVPVIVVPEQSSIETITHLLYASDLKNSKEELKHLIPLATLLMASIKIIHVPPLQYFEQLNTENILTSLKQETGYANIELLLLKSEDILTSIEQYAVASRGDLLVMFTHHIRFLEQLFHKSITREIIWQHQTPLLVLNK